MVVILHKKLLRTALKIVVTKIIIVVCDIIIANAKIRWIYALF